MVHLCLTCTCMHISWRYNKCTLRDIFHVFLVQVIDYVRERAKVHKLEKDMKTWERKVEIAEVGLHALMLVIILCWISLHRIHSTFAILHFLCVQLSLKSQKQAWSRFKQQHDAQTWNAINPPYAN